MTQIMTPHDPRWSEFAGRLSDLISEHGCEGDWGSVHRHTKTTMATMDGIDIDASLAFFKEHGGHCDCEVLLNVEASNRFTHEWADRSTQTETATGRTTNDRQQQRL